MYLDRHMLFFSMLRIRRINYEYLVRFEYHKLTLAYVVVCDHSKNSHIPNMTWHLFILSLRLIYSLKSSIFHQVKNCWVHLKSKIEKTIFRMKQTSIRSHKITKSRFQNHKPTAIPCERSHSDSRFVAVFVIFAGIVYIFCHRNFWEIVDSWQKGDNSMRKKMKNLVEMHFFRS